MTRVTQVAVAGVFLLGATGCSAAAQSGAGPTSSPSITITVIPTPTATIPRQDIRVVVTPSRVVGGSSKTIRISARCPLPRGGTEYRATARSDAFTGLVTLVPPLVTPTPSPAVPVIPEVRGSATLRADARAGGYRVEVRCEATNDVGRARLRVTSPAADVTATPTRVPTRAPRAGGGGTAAGAPQDSGPSTGVVAVLAVVLAAGVAGGVARRRRRG